MSRTTAELDPRHEQIPAEGAAPPPEPRQLPAARIALVRFALVEIEQLPDDVLLAT